MENLIRNFTTKKVERADIILAQLAEIYSAVDSCNLSNGKIICRRLEIIKKL